MFTQRLAVWKIFLKLAVRNHFEYSSREPFVSFTLCATNEDLHMSEAT